MPGLFLFLLGVLVGAAVLYYGCRDQDAAGGGETPAASAPSQDQDSKDGKDKKAKDESPEAARKAVPAAPDHVEPGGETQPEVSVIESPAPAEGGRIALVIDDLGRSVADLETIGKLGIPITYAVLPFEEETPQVVAALRRRGSEILVHLPMEPSNGSDPGPGALRLGMTPEQLRQNTLAALKAVPGAAGVNNHMGSGLSADEGSMKTILGLLSGRGLFFLDSRTSAQSVAYKTAIRLGVPSAERQVFLDSDVTQQAIREQFHRLLGLARTKGAAVAIGHPHPETLSVLEEEVPKARALGYEFVPVSYLLDRPNSPDSADEPDE